MKEIILQRIQDDGKLLRAVFLPDQGMNLASLCFGETEVIDQSTRNIFNERLGGLGAIIGPHFYHRKEIPSVPDETVFPHIARVRKSGSKEPFSHGIGRYVSWNYTASDFSIEASISGMDTHSGVTLAALEGFDFKMNFKAHARSNGLEIDMHVDSEKMPSIAGLHYYYALEDHGGIVKMNVEKNYNDMGIWKPIPDEWKSAKEGELSFNLNQDSDYGFKPGRLDFTGDALLETGMRKLHIHYKTDTEENAFQLYSPKNASYVCIEPVTASNPRDAKQKVNHLKVRIQST